MSASRPILVPREIVNADSVFVVRWLAADGDQVEAGAPLCEIETSKAVVTVEAEAAGFVRHRAGVGDEVAIGGVLGYLAGTPDVILPAGDPPVAGAPVALPAQFSAKARRKLEELGLDPQLFAGSGMVREQDVVAMAARQAEAAAREAAEAHDSRGPFVLEPLGAIQRRVARVMEQSIAAIPASYLERTIDLDPVRQRARSLAGQSKAVIGEVDLLTAAVAAACREFPHFNAFVTAEHHLHRFEHVNVGVATDVEGDLYVVVVREAHAKPPAAIAKELRGLQFMAMRRRLGVEHLSGGTITVTSMLGRGVQRFQPIPYPQQAAIVGLSDVEPGTSRAALCVVFDHRVANGAQAAGFLGAVAEAMVT